MSWGEGIVGIGSSVDNAGAPVSPVISAPSPLDFRRGRGIPSLDLEFVLGCCCFKDSV